MSIGWFNGQYLPNEDIKIDCRDRGLLLGDGLFETVRIEQRHIFYIEEHLRRLDLSLMKLGFDKGVSNQEIIEFAKTLCHKNQINDDLHVLRITITRGSGPRGLLPPSPAQPNIIMTIAPGPKQLPPARVCYSTYTLNENAPSAGLKSVSYMDQVIAFEQARRQNCDEALMFNSMGHLAEGTMSNIFIVTKDKILTPGIWCGALPGIMRQKILELDPNIEEVEITRDLLDQACEIFMTNSLIKIRPVYQLERKTFQDHRETERLKALLDQSEMNMIQASTP